MNVHTSFTYDSQKLESVQMFFNRQVVKQTVVHTNQGLLLDNKNELSIHTNELSVHTTNELLVHTTT